MVKEVIFLVLLFSVFPLTSASLCAGNGEVQIYCDDTLTGQELQHYSVQEQTNSQALQEDKNYSRLGLFISVIIVSFLALVGWIFYTHKELRRLKKG